MRQTAYSLLFGVGLFVYPVQAGQVEWISNLDGFWHIPGNWNCAPALPGLSDDVTIDRPAVDITVTKSAGTTNINTLFSTEDLVLSGGSFSIADDSEIDATLYLAGGTLTGDGSLTASEVVWTGGNVSELFRLDADHLAITSGDQKNLSGIIVSANATWSGGRIAGDGVLTNIGTFEAAANSRLQGLVFNNNGAFTKSSGGEVRFYRTALNNTGIVNVDVGVLSLEGGGTSSGAFNVSSEATLKVDRGTHRFDTNARIRGAGNVSFHSWVSSPRVHIQLVEDFVAVTGDVHMQSSVPLALEAVEPLGDITWPEQDWGDKTVTIITARDVTGSFGHTPGRGASLGYGVFYDDIGYRRHADLPDAVDLLLFQAAPGDTDGDRFLDGMDIQRILAAQTFPNLQPASWTTGDFTADGICDGEDIQAILATNLWDPTGDEPYAVVEPGRPTDSVVKLLFYPTAYDGNRYPAAPAGTLMIDTGQVTINGYVIQSSEGIFTGEPTENLGWFFENSGHQISGNMGFTLNGQHLLGDVIRNERTNVGREFYLDDLSFTYTIDGTPGVYVGTVVVVPEPSSFALLAMGASAVLAYYWRHRKQAE